MPDENDFWGTPGKGTPSKKESSGLRPDAPKRETTFWGKDVAQPEQKPASEGDAYWNKAEKSKKQDQAERDALLKDPDLKKRRRRRIIKRTLVSLLVVIVLTLTLGVVFLPQIAGGFAPGIIQDKAGEAIDGSVAVGDVSLSWGGPQRVEGVRLLDPKGQEVARATVETSAGLFGLIRGNMDLGTVTVTGGKAEIVREADGSTILTRAVAAKGASAKKSEKPSKKPAAEPAETRLPEGLRAKLVVKSLDATVTDKGAGGGPTTVSVRDLDVKATIAPGESLVFETAMKAFEGVLTGRPSAPGGDMTASGKVDGWSRNDGLLTLEKARGKAQVEMTGMPTMLVDVLAPAMVTDAQGKATTLAAALGPAVTMKAFMDSDGAATGVDMDVAFAKASAKGAIAYTGNDLRVTKTFVLKADGSAVRALSPALETSLANSGLTLDAFPNVSVTIEKGAMPLPRAGVLDFRGVPMVATVALEAMTGRVVVDPSQASKAFALEPLTLRVQSDDLAKDAKATLSTRATLEGEPAGVLDVDVTASGLLDAKGGFAGVPGGLNGSVSVKGIASSIVQPWASAANLDLAQDVGPTIDVTLTAVSDAGRASGVTGAAGGTELPPTTVRLDVTSAHLTLQAAVEQTPTAVRSVDSGMTLTLAKGGAIAGRVVGKAGGWTLTPGAESRGVVRVPTFNIPKDTATGRLKLDQIVAELTVDQGPVVMKQEGGAEVRVANVKATLGLKGGGTAKLTADANAMHGSERFDVKAALDATGLYAADEAGTLTFTPPMKVRPSGTVEVKGAPPALAGLFMPAPSEGGLNTATLVADALAGPTDVKVTFKGVAGNAEAVDGAVEVKSPRLTASAGGVVDRQRVALRPGTLNATMTPDLVGTLLRAFAPSMAGSVGEISLAGPARVQASMEAISLPLNADGTLALDRTGTAKARVTLAGQTLVEGLRVTDAGGTRALGRVGVEDFTLRAEVPLAAMFAPPLGEERTARVTIEGQLLGAGGPAVLTFNGTGEGEFSHGKPKGKMSANMKVTRASTRIIEQWAGRDGLLTGLMGPTADIEASVSIAPPEDGYDPAALLNKALVEAGVAVSSARLRADKPVRVRIGSDRIDLVEPATITISPDAVAATEFLSGKVKSGQATLELVDSESITVRLTQFSIPREVRSTGTVATGPAKQAIADVNLTLDAPSITMRSADQQKIVMTGARIAVTTEKVKADKDGKVPPGGPPLAFKIEVAEAKVGEAVPAKGLNLTGRVTTLFAADGVIDLRLARLNMTGQVPAAPTTLLDSMLGQDGALLEALGPVVSAKVTVERLPLMQPGKGADGKHPRFDPSPLIDLEATSPRATLTMRGTVNEGMYVSERPLEVTVNEMTSEFVKRYVGVMPLLGVAEKTKADAPALLRATGMTVPLDKDWSRLNANIDLDPGQCRFQSSGNFASILKAASQKTTGTAGAKIDPLKVTIRNGVSTYERWRVPLGEFTVETVGVVNLTNAPVRVTRPDGKEVTLQARSMDVVTWVPVGAVTDGALGMFNIGLGSMFAKLTPGLLEPLTMLPFRTSGPMDKPETKADTELVGDGVKNQLKKLDPRKLLEGLKPQPATPTPTAPTTPSVPTTPPK